VLALSPLPVEGAGCRFRIAQFIPYLQAHGFDVTLETLFTTEFFQLVYQPRHYLRKAMAFARLSIDRLLALRKLPDFDVILLYREIFPIGPAVVERLLARRGHPPIVFDFDDAIFLPAVSHANRFISALKYPGKVKTIIRSADHVIAGNDYLASYAERYNRSVTTIPTCVDTDRFVPRADGARSATPPVVGWIGSPTTAIYIADLAPVLRRVAETDAFVARISGAGAAIEMPRVRMENARWSLDDEVRLFNTCDIGVYPLTDDEWSRGKCGFKAIQFMACGVPVVASAVGVNREIIQDGVNGFLASSEAEWVDKIRRLLNDATLRRRMAEAGRRTVERSYSLHVHAPALASTLRNVVDVRRGGRTAAARVS